MPRFYDLPLQPLSLALIEFAQQSNSSVIFEPAIVNGIDSTPIVGYFNEKTALSLLVAKANVKILSDESIFTLLPGFSSLPNSFMVEEQASFKPLLEQVKVFGSRYPHRYSGQLNTFDRNGVSFFDSARYHSVISKEAIADTKPFNLMDFLKIYGVSPGAVGCCALYSNYYVRGYEKNNLYLNGFRLSDRTAIEIASGGVERVEVLKGPAMLFFGQSGAGGVVNIVYNRPSELSGTKISHKMSISQESSSYIDWSNKLNKKNNTRVLLYENSLSQSDLIDSSILGVNISSNWVISDKTQLDIRYEWQGNQKKLSEYPISKIQSQLKYTYSDVYPEHKFSSQADVHLLSGSLHYTFYDGWKISVGSLWQEERRLGYFFDDALRYEDVLLSREYSEFYSGFVTLGGRSVSLIDEVLCDLSECSLLSSAMTLENQKEYETGLSFNASISGSFDLNRSQVRFVLGVDAYHQDLYRLYSVGDRDYTIPAGLWSKSPEFITEEDLIELYVRGDEYQQFVDRAKEYRALRSDYGIYMQMYFDLNSYFKLSTGWRFSSFGGEQRDITNQSIGLVGDVKDTSAQYGVLFQPNDQASLFFNYSETIAIKYLIDDRQQFSSSPEIANQYELGMKWSSFNGDLSLSGSIYTIEKSNIHEIQWIDNIRTLIGPYRHGVKGVEFEATLNSSDDFQLILHWEARSNDVHADDYKHLESLAGTPEYGLLVRKHFSSDWSSTLSYYFSGSRELNYDIDSYILESYSTIDISLERLVEQSWGAIKIDFIAKNVLNKKYEQLYLPWSGFVESSGMSVFLETTFSW